MCVECVICCCVCGRVRVSVCGCLVGCVAVRVVVYACAMCVGCLLGGCIVCACDSGGGGGVCMFVM